MTQDTKTRSNEALQASELSLSDLDNVTGGCPPPTGSGGFGVLPDYSNDTGYIPRGTPYKGKSRKSRYYHPGP